MSKNAIATGIIGGLGQGLSIYMLEKRRQEAADARAGKNPVAADAGAAASKTPAAAATTAATQPAVNPAPAVGATPAAAITPATAPVTPAADAMPAAAATEAPATLDAPRYFTKADFDNAPEYGAGTNPSWNELEGMA